MEPYIIIFTVVFFLNLFASRAKNNWVKILLSSISMITLIAFIGFRKNVGTDYEAYTENYQYIKSLPFDRAVSTRLEPFVAILYKTFSNIFTDYHWIYFMYGMLSIVPLYLANWKYKHKYLALSVLIYCMMFLPFTLNGMRQGVSMSLILLAFTLIDKKISIKSLGCLILAILFHLPSVIVIPYYVAKQYSEKKGKSFSKMNIYLTIAISAFIMLFLKDYLYDHDMASYGIYLKNASIENMSLGSIITYIPVIALCYYNHRKTKNEDNVKSLTPMIYTGICFQVLGTVAQYLNRFALYFLPIMTLEIPIIISKINKKDARNTVTILFIVYVISYFIIQFVMWGRHDIIPYQTWI